MKDLPKEGHFYRIWKVVERMVVDRRDDLEGERMRDSYYLLREWLEPLRDADEITAAVNEVMADVDAEGYPPDWGDGPLMSLRHKPTYSAASLDTGDLRDELEEVAETKLDALIWWRQSRYEEAVIGEISEGDIEHIERTLANADT